MLRVPFSGRVTGRTSAYRYSNARVATLVSWVFTGSLGGAPLVALAASPLAMMTPARDSIAIRARPLDPSGSEIYIETTAGGIRFSVSELTLRSSPQATKPLPPEDPSIRVQAGVIRWYTTGTPSRERLALLVLDTQRFVAWTPSGYFASLGEGADTAIGVWSELADGRRHLIPAREFRKDYWRPDIVRWALATDNERLAIVEANRVLGLSAEAPPLAKLLPPVGVIASPEDGTLLKGPSAEITVEIFAPTGTAVVSSSPAAGARGMVATGGRRTEREGTSSWKERVRVSLPDPPRNRRAPHEAMILLQPPSLHGRSVQLHLHWDNGWRIAMPDLYVLTVGVNQYQEADEFPALRFAAKDARDVAGTLQAQQGRRYRHVFSQVLMDQQASLTVLREKLTWLQREPQERDVVMIFLAGHGTGSGLGRSQRYYFVPHDGNVEHLSQTTLSDEELFQTLSRFRSSTVVLFLDTCRAGTTPAQRRLMEELQAGSGVVVYSATKANRPSQERARWQNGAFTRALLEGLHGGADVNGDGRITASGLEHYIATRVKALTNGEQEPTTVKATTDLWLAQSQPPLWRRWWLWTTVAGVAAAGVTAGIVAGSITGAKPGVDVWNPTFSRKGL